MIDKEGFLFRWLLALDENRNFVFLDEVSVSKGVLDKVTLCRDETSVEVTVA